MTKNITIHIGYESVASRYLAKSPHMRLRISGIVESVHKNYKIVHSSEDCQEALMNCTRAIPDVALLSKLLPIDNDVGLDELIAFLQKHGTKIIILYKRSEENIASGTLMIQTLPGIAGYVRVKDLKVSLPKLLNV